MTLPSLPRRFGLPLAMQLIAILICALLAAQLVTLGLTVLLPPAAQPRWDMDEVAAALSSDHIADRLERKQMAGPPDVAGQGWLVSQSSRDALARRLGKRSDEVILAFYTELPVGGVAVPSETRSPLAVAKPAGPGGLSSLLIETAQAQSIPGGPPPGGGGMGPGGMPGGGFPGGRPPGGAFPGGPGPGSSFPGSGGPRPSMPSGGIGRPGGGTTISIPARPSQPMQPGIATPPIGPSSVMRPGSQSPGQVALPATPQIISSSVSAMDSPTVTLHDDDSAPTATPTPVARISAPAQPSPEHTAVAETQAPLVHETQAAAPARVAEAPVANATPQPIPFRRERATLFDMATPPFIEGDFVAAARQPDGSWLAVAPRAEPFPNAWQKRVMLWFALSLAIISPLAWLFARRIVVPLRDFARAAEQLGRDPSATILPLSGPAEIGRAANAFNQMRHRLRSFVDDRTAMVGAISHDLRTPLTRLRFRIEDVPDDQRDGLLREVTEMEAMISQVIAFIRDASTPGPRERVDFADLVAGSVADARMIGADVEIEQSANIPVDVDPVGIRRLLGNLLENAIKYGESAKVRVSLREGEAVAEIIDAGPGIPEEEFDRAFEPFYRSDAALSSGRNGTGLGLTVCRSIARAHGGDVSFAHANEGFVARVTVPAAFNPTLRKAA